MTINVSVPAHVYVVNEDDQGEVYLLFPLPGQTLENPVPPGAAHRLPGTIGTQEQYWQVTSAGGREHFLIFASPERLTAFETLLTSLPKPEAGRPVTSAAVTTATAQLLRGVGGLAPAAAAAPASAGARLSAQFTTPLPQAEEVVNGVWIRQLTLDNPR